jgi:hypothetical protein
MLNGLRDKLIGEMKVQGIDIYYPSADKKNDT